MKNRTNVWGDNKPLRGLRGLVRAEQRSAARSLFICVCEQQDMKGLKSMQVMKSLKETEGTKGKGRC